METGDSAVAVAAIASIWVKAGSMSEEVGRTADDEAAKTASTAKAKTRTESMFAEI